MMAPPAGIGPASMDTGVIGPRLKGAAVVEMSASILAICASISGVPRSKSSNF